jgi:hypothetical protein
MTLPRIQELESLDFKWKRSRGRQRSQVLAKGPWGHQKFTSTSSWFEPQNIRRVEAGDARLDKTDLDG